LFLLLLGCSIPSSSAAPSVGLVDFNANNGDLVVISTNNPGGPWSHDSALGTWSAFDTADCATAPRSSRLNTPGWTVVAAGVVTLTFTHRYSWEADTTRWDGGQVRLSLNGGAYATVPLANFTANGYNNTIGGAAVPTSELVNQPAFTAESAGYPEGAYITSVARLGTFNAGDVISVQFIGAWDDCSQGQVPNWEIDSIQFTPSLEDRRPPPSFTNSTLPADAAVQEGKSHTLRASVTGQTSLQWFKDGIAIPGADRPSYFIASMTAADAGQYHLEAYNAIGTASSRTATITMVDDRTAPIMLLAFSDASDLNRFTLWVNEPVCIDEATCGSDADDYFNYALESLDGFQTLEVSQVTVTDGTNLVLTTSAPRTPGVAYKLYADRGVGLGDIYGNVIPAGPLSQINVTEPVVFQQTLNDYAGTQDTELRGAAPAAVQGANTFVTVDNADGGGVSQGLLRFGDLFGSGPGQIPPGSTILSSRLTLTHGNGTGPDGDVVNAHRMLVAWDQSTATYNSLVAGVTANGVEAVASPDFVITSTGLTVGQKLSFDVSASLQAWSNGEVNQGWAFIPTGGNGYRWDTSESAVAGSQPRLEVLYTVPPCAPVAITQQPAPTTTLNEGGSFTLSVSVQSQGCPPTFQWSRNNVDIPGATAASYAVLNANPAAHSGTYRVRIANSLPSSVVSDPAVVTVIGDTIKPTVVSAVSEADLVTITVIFSEAVSASASLPGNYSLVPAGGGAPLSLTLTRVNPTTVTLTTPQRTLGTTYNLSVSGITDLASTPNTITSVVIPITARSRRLLAADAAWRYDQTSNFDPTLAGGETPWHAPAFDDSAWLSGQGMFGLETAGVIAAVPLPGALIRTPWTIGAAQITYYLRTALTVPAGPAGAVLILRHATDDGMVAYVNGEEKARYNIASPQPVLHDYLAPAAAPEGVVVCNTLPGVPAGTHTLAVEVHQSATTSSDVVFGAEVLQVLLPAVQAVRNPDGSVSLSWDNDPMWVLVQSDNVTGPYTAVPNNPTSPYLAAPPTSALFYQLQCR
jgi:hypothetical protein